MVVNEVIILLSSWLSLMTSDGAHLFLCPLAISVSFGWRSTWTLCLFLNWVIYLHQIKTDFNIFRCNSSVICMICKYFLIFWNRMSQVSFSFSIFQPLFLPLESWDYRLLLPFSPSQCCPVTLHITDLVTFCHLPYSHPLQPLFLSVP